MGGARAEQHVASVSACMREMRRRDPLGQRIHGIMAMAYLFLLPLWTFPKEPAFLILVGYAIIRLPNTWRCYTAVLRDPLLWALLAWAAWLATSIAWSVDPDEGLKETLTFRVVLTPWALWPVIDWTPRLIAAFLAGVFGQNIAQAMQYLHLFGMEPDPNDDRLRGLLHPIQTGALCLTACCWHGAALLRAAPMRAVTRVAMLAAGGAALGGLVLAGSRGPWLAAAVALPTTLITIAVRRPSSRRRAMISAACLLLLAAGAWPLAGGFVMQRVDRAQQELRAAVQAHEYDSSLGLRVLMWSWSWKFFTQEPIAGTGAGSFRVLARQQPQASRLRDFTPKGHPHSTPLHALSATGAIGGVIVATVLVLAIIRCAREPDDHLFAGGALGVLAGWIVGSQFDSYHLNGHLMGLLTFLIAITLPYRPAPLSAHGAGDIDPLPGQATA